MYLIEVCRQLFIAFEFIARKIGNDFFVGRTKHERVAMAVFKTKQFRAVLDISTRFFP
ncbi:hypothetical protein D3C80_1889080 [compost metagenome]